MLIVFIVFYPAILIFLGIRNRKNRTVSKKDIPLCDQNLDTQSVSSENTYDNRIQTIPISPSAPKNKIIIENDLRIKKKCRKKNHKRLGYIASYIILSFIIIGLSIFLIISEIQNQDYIKSNQNTIDELNKENEALRGSLVIANSDLEIATNAKEYYRSQANKYQKTLTEQTYLVNQYKKEAEQWKQKYLNSDSDNSSYAYSFNSVYSLLKAIKNNPKKYNGKQIKVIGTVCKKEKWETVLFDNDDDFVFSNDLGIRALLYLGECEDNGKLILITISDDVMYTVLENGNYIKIYGTVKIENNQLALDKCEYERISQ